MRYRDCRFCDHFLSENKYWCYLKKMYVEPEQPNCDKFKPPIRRPLDKYVKNNTAKLLTSFYFDYSGRKN